MRRIVLVLLCWLVGCLSALKKSSCKWAQTADTLLITVPLKRGQTRCEDEMAKLTKVGRSQKLRFHTVCGDDEFELDLVLQHNVIGKKGAKLKPDARRAEALITLHKAKPGRKWTHLVSQPELYSKGLIEKDWSRWEDEEDEEDAEEAQRAAEANERLQRENDAVEEAARAAQARREGSPKTRDARAQQARLRRATEQLQRGEASPATLAAIQAEAEAAPDDTQLQLLLSQALTMSGDTEGSLRTLRAVHALSPAAPGVPQMLARTLQTTAEGATPAGRKQAAKLYRAGLKAYPDDAESYYQLGLLAQKKAPPRDDAADEAIAAWRGAVAARPAMAEAHTLLAMRLALGEGKRARRQAKAHAERAVSLAPSLGSSYSALAKALVGTTPPLQMPPKALAKAAGALQAGVGLSWNGAPPLAEAYHTLGVLLAAQRKWDHNDTLAAFEAAARLEPSAPRHAEALARHREGLPTHLSTSRGELEVEQARREEARREKNVERYIEQLREREAAEEKEAEDDQDDFVDVRVYKQHKPKKQREPMRTSDDEYDPRDDI